jgi:hypothetical protein
MAQEHSLEIPEAKWRHAPLVRRLSHFPRARTLPSLCMTEDAGNEGATCADIRENLFFGCPEIFVLSSFSV